MTSRTAIAIRHVPFEDLGLAHPQLVAAGFDVAYRDATEDELAAIVADDPDRTVRLAAIERLEAVDALARVLDDDAVADAAARRIQTLCAQQGRALPDHPRLRALNLLQANPDERRSRIARAAALLPSRITALAGIAPSAGSSAVHAAPPVSWRGRGR